MGTESKYLKLSMDVQNILRDRKNALRSKISDINNPEHTPTNADGALSILRAKIDEIDTISEKIFKLLISNYNDKSDEQIR